MPQWVILNDEANADNDTRPMWQPLTICRPTGPLSPHLFVSVLQAWMLSVYYYIYLFQFTQYSVAGDMVKTERQKYIH